MRHSTFLHLALGLLSWSSQALGASADREVLVSLSWHPPRPGKLVEKHSARSLRWRWSSIASQMSRDDG